MVAITVILAAVIGVFVLGLGDELGEAQPSNSLTINGDLEYNTDLNTEDGSEDTLVWDGWENLDITVSHDSGDSFNSDDIRIVIREDNSNVGEFSGSDLSPAGEEISVGDSLELVGGLASEVDEPSDPGDASADEDFDAESAEWTVDIVHTPSDSIIGSSEVDLEESS